MHNITKAHILPSIPPLSNIANYINYAYKIPFLSAEEESVLAQEKENGNYIAAQILIISQLKTVIRTALKYVGYGLPLEDLIQEGNIGLMRAVKSFDPNKGVRLITYAINWIKGEIQEYVSSNWGNVKIATTKEMKKLFFNYRSTKNRLESIGFKDNELNKAISNELSVDEECVREMEKRINNYDVDLSDPCVYIEGINNIETKEKELDCVKLVHELERLTPNEKFIIENKFLTDEIKTNIEIGNYLNLSKERVRQIEGDIINKIKKALN